MKKSSNKLQRFKDWGSTSGQLGGLGVRKDHFIILGVHRTKKVKNHCSKSFFDACIFNFESEFPDQNAT